jgi:hypothetical protein
MDWAAFTRSKRIENPFVDLLLCDVVVRAQSCRGHDRATGPVDSSCLCRTAPVRLSYPFTTNAAAPISDFRAFKLKLDIACGATSWAQSRTVVSRERQMAQRP